MPDARLTYNDIHKIVGQTAQKIVESGFQPDLIVAIGRSFLKVQGRKNIPIQAIGLSLYEEMGNLGGTVEATEAEKDDGLAKPEQMGKEIIRVQWLDKSALGNRPLIGRSILIVDEVDDSRTTLDYAVRELQKDIAEQLALLDAEAKAKLPETKLGVFVVVNKEKEKAGSIPANVEYFVGQTVGDVWVHYPWEARDIEEHDRLAQAGA